MPVIHVYGGCRRGIELRQERVGPRWIGVVDTLDARSGAWGCGRRDLEISKCRAEVQTGAARDDRRPPYVDETVDGIVCEPRILADGHRLIQLANPDQLRRLDGLIGEDRQAAIYLKRVG